MRRYGFIIALLLAFITSAHAAENNSPGNNPLSAATPEGGDPNGKTIRFAVIKMVDGAPKVEAVGGNRPVAVNPKTGAAWTMGDLRAAGFNPEALTKAPEGQK